MTFILLDHFLSFKMTPYSLKLITAIREPMRIILSTHPNFDYSEHIVDLRRIITFSCTKNLFLECIKSFEELICDMSQYPFYNASSMFSEIVPKFHK